MKNRGITIISLIITIILLLILTGVSLGFINSKKVTNSARRLVNQTEEQMNKHDEMVNDVRNII